MFDREALEIAISHIPLFCDSEHVDFSDFTHFVSGHVKLDVPQRGVQSLGGKDDLGRIVDGALDLELEDARAELADLFLEGDPVETAPREVGDLGLVLLHELLRSKDLLEYALLDLQFLPQEFVAVVVGDLGLHRPHVPNVHVFDVKHFLFLDAAAVVQHKGIGCAVTDHLQAELAFEYLSRVRCEGDSVCGDGEATY